MYEDETNFYIYGIKERIIYKQYLFCSSSTFMNGVNTFVLFMLFSDNILLQQYVLFWQHPILCQYNTSAIFSDLVSNSKLKSTPYSISDSFMPLAKSNWLLNIWSLSISYPGADNRKLQLQQHHGIKKC